ncbi:hypothetical protein HC251_21395 [Iamia sp. SCSIO 61187]|uniref:hypothetical protein n=1 Tax=Iamia sp. SCSIO 61187 TaxID=2722752 RepID=UPI001C630EF4|nr:hypothetical protein [Iamia sp. SCSIO 61187]QYG94738.1 hypothetical protein HC251_21395 [Iamia sp. SCSIO 61187]
MNIPFRRKTTPWQRALAPLARAVPRTIPAGRARTAVGVVGAAVAATAASAAASSARQGSS